VQFTILNTPTKGNQTCGDVMSKYNDNVQLIGVGYSNMTVVKIPALSLTESSILDPTIININEENQTSTPKNLSNLTVSDVNYLLTATKEESLILLNNKIV